MGTEGEDGERDQPSRSCGEALRTPAPPPGFGDLGAQGQEERWGRGPRWCRRTHFSQPSSPGDKNTSLQNQLLILLLRRLQPRTAIWC